jgi:hypothetical protein
MFIFCCAEVYYAEICIASYLYCRYHFSFSLLQFRPLQPELLLPSTVNRTVPPDSLSLTGIPHLYPRAGFLVPSLFKLLVTIYPGLAICYGKQEKTETFTVENDPVYVAQLCVVTALSNE